MNSKLDLQHENVLDFVRGMAALLVVAGHLRALIFENWSGGGILEMMFYSATALGHQAVLVFFVLSGYLVGGSAIAAVQSNSWDFRRYFLRRYIRLSVVLIPALILTYTFDRFGLVAGFAPDLYSGNAGGALITYDVDDRLGVGEFFGNLLFLGSIFTDTFGSNGALWSLAYEFWFYMLFPLLLVPISNRSWNGVLYGLLILFGFFWLSGVEGAAYFAIWCLGALVAFIKMNSPVFWKWYRSSLVGTCVVFFATLAYSVKAPASVVVDLVLGFSFSLLLLFALGMRSSSGRFSRVSGFMAKISYSLYATHMPFAVLLVAYLTGGIRAQVDAMSLLTYLFVLLSVVALAFGFWAVFERYTASIQRTVRSRFFP